MATSRLKKRIEQVSNEDDSNKGYGNLLESFVSYGKALPSLASTSKDSNEFVPIWKQEVHDEQGRRRLHGAFTGGFSAGYFNTVGSKEGWTPKAFTSSRSTRATKDDQTTEDLAKSLMDDEDLADLRSAQTLQTNSAYSNPTPSYDPLSGHSNSPSLAPTAALASLIQPSTARIGLKLMRKMGWREGQGVGPRVTLEQRRIMAKELGIQIEEEDASEEAARHYYAPLDRPLNTLKEVGASADRGWGLGYLPSGSLSASARIAPNTTSVQWSYINDTDNIYSTADSIGFGINGEKVRPKWVVDLEVQDEDEGEYAINASGERAGQPLAKRTSKDSNMATFHDSTACLPGFKIQRETNYGASTSQLPPPPPTRWKPEPSRIWQGTGSGTDSKGKGREMDADQRGNLLGEPQPAPVAKSVFDYMSAKSRERLAQISSNPSSFTPGTSSNSTPLINNSRVPPPPILEPDDPLNIPTLEAPTALAALSGFQPFSVNSASADAIRQARYTLFLQFQARLLPPTALPSSLPFGPRTLPTGKVQTIKELNRELDDYARAARVFKPVSGMLAGRFTSNVTGTTLEVPTVTPGLSQPKPKAIIIPTEINDGNQLIENLTPAQSAARAGMFGRMTRTLDDFHPAKLLCKRFGIRNPHPDREDEEEEVGGAWKEAGRGAVSRKPAGDILNKESMEQLMKSSGFRKFESPSQTTISTKDLSLIEDIPINTQLKEERKTLANVGLGEDETQGAEILTYTKAPADIFAAIFADSDDEDDEDDIPLPIPSKPSTTTLNTSQMSPIATQLPEPSSISAAIEEEPLSMENLSSYRPSFSKTSKESTVPVEKKKKKSKRKAAKAALSFEIEEGEEVMEFSSKKKIKTNASAPTMKVEDEWTVAEPSVHQSILNTQVNRSKASDLF